MSQTRFWHPYADMSRVNGQEFVLSRGEGAWVWDESGRKYFDATASLWYCFVGHGRPELAEAAANQIKRLEAFSAYGDCATRPTIELAERVAAISPIRNAAVFFTSGGAESIETAAKLARRYWNVTGRPERQLLVFREGAYHGSGGYGTSIGGIDANVTGFGSLMPGVIRIPADDPSALARVIEEHPRQVAAFIGEPVRGAGGVYPPADGYWKDIQEICRKNDVLLIADEVITGFGRMGTWFASSRYGIQPDMITGAKGVTSGYLPLGVLICGERVQEPFWRGTAGVFRHGYTYSGHTTACAVGLANLAIIENENLVRRAADLEPVLAGEVKKLKHHAMVENVRCAGLLAAIEISREVRARASNIVDVAVNEAKNQGLLTRGLVGHSLQISPPLIVTADDIRRMVEGFASALNSLETQIAGVAAGSR
jgi:putrescine---pyruvate transaminase